MMKQAASEKAKVRTSSLDSPRTAHSQGWFSPLPRVVQPTPRGGSAHSQGWFSPLPGVVQPTPRGGSAHPWGSVLCT